MSRSANPGKVEIYEEVELGNNFPAANFQSCALPRRESPDCHSNNHSDNIITVQLLHFFSGYLYPEQDVNSSAELILTLKNRESIHLG